MTMGDSDVTSGTGQSGETHRPTITLGIPLIGHFTLPIDMEGIRCSGSQKARAGCGPVIEAYRNAQ